MDLLQPRHEPVFIGAAAPGGMRECEGIPVRPLAWPARASEGWLLANRLREILFNSSLAAALRRAFEDSGSSLALCLDERMASAASRAGIPWGLRLHSHPGLLPRTGYEELIRGALFVTGSQPDIPGAVFLPHSVDLSRFEYREPARAEAVVMTSSLVDAEQPDLFVRGAAASGLRGTLAGQGPLRREMEALCSETGGRVRLLPPVNRMALPKLLSAHQIGVACLTRGWHTTYQMKVTEYQASGLFPLVQPWSELAREAPSLTRTFEDAAGLAGEIERLASGWADTLDQRRANRTFAYERYSIEKARMQFDEILQGLDLPVRGHL
jgi:hypothetical protein